MKKLALPLALFALSAGSLLAQYGGRYQAPPPQQGGYGWNNPGAFQQPPPHRQAPVYQETQRTTGGGLYLSAFGGLNTVDDLDVSGAGLSASAETKGGTAFGLAFGSANTRNGGLYTRWEIEGSYRSNDLESLNLLGLSSSLGGGDLSALGVHLNGFIGMPIGQSLTVYAGAGIGVSKLDAGVDLGDISFDETVTGSLSYQFMLGLEFGLSPNMSVFGEYRYYRVSSDLGFDALDSLGSSLDVDIDPFDYNSSSFVVGLRLYF